MNAVARALAWRRQAIGRELWAGLLGLLSWLLPGAMLVWRVGMPVWLAIAAAIGFCFAAWRGHAIRTRHDTQWLIRQLDSRLPDLEDSSDLLWRSPAALSRLQQLQRQRITARIERMPAPDLRRPWPKARIGLSWLSAGLLSVLVLYWPAPGASPPVQNQTAAAAVRAAALPVTLQGVQVRITPPAYTGLPVRRQVALAARFPEGARLHWQLRFQPEPASAELVFFDGLRLPLRRQDGQWLATRVMADSDVYRIEADGAPLPPGKWQRLDATPDQPPVIRVLQPARSLELLTAGQSQWRLVFEAEDDHGLGQAELELQLAQGSGENIEFKRMVQALSGRGSDTRRRFEHRVDLSALGMQAGDDLIAQFRIVDRRQPRPNESRSSSFILRWPTADDTQATGIEGMLKKVAPAYFRSQRQIIIDTEKLLAQRGKLDAETFAIRSDTIGVDQRLLRLRYGQFLGEESEGGRAHAPAPGGPEEHEDHDEHSDHDSHAATQADDHDHAHQQQEKPKAGGGSESILEQFGHTHDIPEAATLLDPETKRLLRAALNEMWQAELHLRTAEPKKALPYEYRALDYIKQVQQASRIYLAKVGNNLPPVDESRRLSGDTAGYAHPLDSLTVATPDDAPLLAFWQTLTADATGRPDYAALRRWLAEHPARVPDPLGLKVAMAELQANPDCRACRHTLQRLLWPVLPDVPAVPQARPVPASDDAYRKALQQERRR